MTELTAQRVLADARTIIRSAALGWLMTTGDDGRVAARVMQPFPVGDDLVLWYGTSPTSRKVSDIARLPVATAGFQSSDAAGYASVSGPVSVVTDVGSRRHRWRPEWSAYFPGGPDEGYVLLRLDPDRIEVLDFAHDIAPPPFGAVAAAVTRTPTGTDWNFSPDTGGSPPD